MKQAISEVVDSGIRAAPPIGISAASFAGMSMEDWMYIATILYTLLQAGFLLYKWFLGHKEERRNSKKRKELNHDKIIQEVHRERHWVSKRTDDRAVPSKGNEDS